jgi:hypothetical protein
MLRARFPAINEFNALVADSTLLVKEARPLIPSYFGITPSTNVFTGRAYPAS